MGSSPTAPTMTREEIYNIPKCAGIYCIKNTINNKCYIGQSIKLHKRLKAHWNNWNNPMYSHIALYRAIKKYGIDKFEVSILETFHDSLEYRVKLKLDELEKKYIQEYDSYNNGYNSTLGGDGGVLGYIHPDNIKERIKNKVQEYLGRLKEDPENWIKAKNIETNIVIIGKSSAELSKLINVPIYSINKCLNKKQLFSNKVWIFSKYEDEFPNAPQYNSEEYLERIKCQFKELSNKEDIIDYIKNNPYCSYGEIAQNYNLSKKTFYNYKEELSIKPEQRIDTKVTKDIFLEYIKDHSKDETKNHFGISDRRYYKYLNKYRT